MPTPAAPTTVTSSQAGPVRTRSQAAASEASSCSSTDERLVEAALATSAETRYEPPGGHGSPLPLSVERLDGLDLHSVLHQTERRLAEQDLARLRRLLEPRGDVDGVPCREPLRGAGHHLAGVDADPPLDAELGERPRISAAARTARSASSSRTVGTPKTAITASPMNFSTVPP